MLRETPFKLTKNIGLVFLVVFVVVAIITWVAARETIRVVAPVIIWIYAVCSVLAAIGMTIIFYVGGVEWIKTRLAQWRRDQTLADNEGRRDDLETDQMRTQLRAQERLMAAAIRQVERGMIHPSTLADHKFSSFPAATIKQIAPPALPLLEAAPSPLLPTLKAVERIMIYGPPDSGKTTLLRYLVDLKLEIGKVLVIDPHGNKPKWGHTSHIGQGRDFRGIGIMLDQIVKEITFRFEQEAIHPELIDNHPYVTVVIDELRAIVKECKVAGKCLGTIICEGRKINIHIVFIAHSKTVKGLGIEGEGDIRTGITQVTLYGNKDVERSATRHIIGFEEPVKVALPGAYVDPEFNRQVTQAKPKPDSTDVVTDEPERVSILNLDTMPESAAGMIDQQVIACYLETGSYSQAFRKLYELKNDKTYAGKIGGNQTAKVKALLDKYEVKHPVTSS